MIPIRRLVAVLQSFAERYYRYDVVTDVPPNITKSLRISNLPYGKADFTIRNKIDHKTNSCISVQFLKLFSISKSVAIYDRNLVNSILCNFGMGGKKAVCYPAAFVIVVTRKFIILVNRRNPLLDNCIYGRLAKELGINSSKSELAFFSRKHQMLC